MDDTQTLYVEISTTLAGLEAKTRQELSAAGFENISSSKMSILALTADVPMSIVQVAGLRQVSKQAVQSQVQDIAKAGWVEIVPDPKDRRIRLVSPSKKGRQVLAALSEIQARLDGEIEVKLGTQRLKNFRNMLGQINAAVG